MLIDTHVLIWAVQDDARLGKRARRAIDAAADADALHVSAITAWEVAMLAHKGRVTLGKEAGAWIDEALGLPGMRLTPLLPSIAVDSVRLPGDALKDPADRIIIASARHVGVPLLTADKVILRYGDAGYVAVQDASR
ncbi:type II toxin-antitoxin system VapC family toxin [Reyranella sp. CPCC 100927]|uniref:type II toxin-antitoxin system VapC family toxin n=1 Tax=Reyranella sp. CPCC 100927 TaxID=2599616 RepID=UPI0011B77634|nr:type II toxin-antitoxin system VapC family toxin [Reyranella sp. CPCC 100927]TWT03134.1 type II toxin-antitoxin system VapC family toxin [Reyranella sp. CPCC 100927]